MRYPPTLTMRRGDTSGWSALAVQPDGSPLDLTGYTLWFTAKRAIADTDAQAVFQLTNGAGITITDAAAGAFAINPRRADTSSLTEDVRLYVDVQASKDPESTDTLWPPEDDNGNWQPGILIISRDITRQP